MKSFLDNRPRTERFKVNLPATKPPALQQRPQQAKDGLEETVVQAEALDDAQGAPQVDLVMRDGVVHKIIVHLPDGHRLELDCEYSE